MAATATATTTLPFAAPKQSPANNYFANPAQPTGPSPPADATAAYFNSSTKPVYGVTMSQTPPSANVSPTSVQPPAVTTPGAVPPPITANPPRQLRPARQPLYTPAALRPTDHATRPTDIPGRPRAPDTPPASKDSSFNSGRGNSPHGSGSSSARNGSSSSATLTPLTGDSNLPSSNLPDLADFDLLRRHSTSATGLDDADLFLSPSALSTNSTPAPDTPPTTAHWKPDASAQGCSICAVAFTWYLRRHHCRRCGNLVCDAHSRRRVPLDQHARYHPRGMQSRACESCYEEWGVVKSRLRMRHERVGSSSSAAMSIPSPVSGAIEAGQRKGFLAEARVGSMARSEGMVWSTF